MKPTSAQIVALNTFIEFCDTYGVDEAERLFGTPTIDALRRIVSPEFVPQEAHHDGE
jgi:hypothetical protein